ncbi:serine hydrolase domain-containing protein, partial [Streptomyces sp. NPDC057927]
MTQPAPRVHGHCDARFAAVRTAFEENFRDRDELGAAVTVTLDGESVVDLWGGWADAARTRPWERETLVNVWSTSKGPTALCAHILADRGLLDFDAPVAAYWPEFAAAGKESVLVRHLLSHRAGLAGLREPHDLAQLCDWELTVERLAAQEPWWEPGTRSGYHALTFGHLVGEVVRRVSGLRPGAFLEREVTGPLGIDFTIGLPEKEAERAAELVHPPVASSSEQAAIFAQLAPAAVAALANPLVGAAEANTARWRAAEIPAANGHGTARAVAALYGIFAGRGAYGSRQVLSPEAAERVR